jgi:hypothetical protein
MKELIRPLFIGDILISLGGWAIVLIRLSTLKFLPRDTFNAV